jgi:hypothetical protein
MLETAAFLVFASAIWYVVYWSVKNDDMIPPEQRKRRFGSKAKSPAVAPTSEGKSPVEPK